MTKIELIEKQIADLDYDSFAKLREWFIEFDQAIGDKKIESDSNSGKLDFLINTELAEHEAGETVDLGSIKQHLTFGSVYEYLPVDIRDLADKNFLLLKNNPSHPSLQFKKVGKVWSVKVGSNYRAIATQIDEGYLWIWIGTHAEYDKLLR